MSDQPPLSRPAHRLVEILAEHAHGLGTADVTRVAQERIRGLPAARIAALLDEAKAAGAVVDRDGRLHVANDDDPEDGREAPRRRPMRAVIIDVESVVRTTASEPYTERRIYQIGAVRAGADADWVAAEPPLSLWLELPSDGDWAILSDRVRAQHTAGALVPAVALAALQAYVGDADALVAYNGTDADFPMLADAFEREGIPGFGGQLIDAYYLALAVWPTAPSHRLAVLAEHVGAATKDLEWHDAADGAIVKSCGSMTMPVR